MTGPRRWPQHPLNKRGFCNLVGISRCQIKHECFSQVFSATAFSFWPSHASKASRLIPIARDHVCHRHELILWVLSIPPQFLVSDTVILWVQIYGNTGNAKRVIGTKKEQGAALGTRFLGCGCDQRIEDYGLDATGTWQLARRRSAPLAAV